MFDLPCWQELFQRFKVQLCKFDQCMIGLRMLDWPFLPVKKPTVLVCSTETLLRPFAKCQCNGKHEHASITTLSGQQHSTASRYMQVWPTRMCRMIAAAVADCVHEAVTRRMHLLTEDSKIEAYVECIGCKHHRKAG